jgi:uncharacterized membrane protein
MKLFKTLLLIWLALLGILITLLMFKDAEKTKIYKKFKSFLEDDDEDK